MIARFVIQEHHATTFHYDLRLEIDGYLKSWAIPKGFSMDPSKSRLAITTGDHALSYISFEGTRRRGIRGAGEVLIWDKGNFEADDRIEEQIAMELFRFKLHGSVLRGEFKMKRIKEKGDKWFLKKVADEFTTPSFECVPRLVPLIDRGFPLFAFSTELGNSPYIVREDEQGDRW